MGDKFAVKGRIQTFNSIDSLTYSMQIISIIKLKKILQLLGSAKMLAPAVAEMMKMVLCHHIKTHDYKPVGNKKLVIALVSNRGFCGEFNGEVKKQLLKYQNEQDTLQVYVVGKKGKDVVKPQWFKNIKYINFYRDEHEVIADADRAEDLSLKKVIALVEEIIPMIASQEVSSIKLIFNEFESILRQRIKVTDLFPIAVTKDDFKRAENYIYEPVPDITSFAHYLNSYVSTALYLHALESEAGELGARFLMMKNSTDSCKKNITELTLELNKIRQAAITKDLSEIVSGFKVLKRERS